MAEDFSIRPISVFISIVFIIIIFLPGCSGLIKPKGRPDAEIYTGTSGLEISFLQNAPPNEIIAPEKGTIPFQAGLKLENRGAADIKEGYLLLAVEQNYVNILEWQTGNKERFDQLGASGEKVAFRLDGKSDLDPEGEIETIIANLEVLPLGSQSVGRTTTIGATACYNYMTKASANVCIDPDIYNLKPSDKVCDVNDVSLSGGQGAPVSINKVEVSMIPSGEFAKPQFILHISNEGRGIVFRPDKVRDACSASPLKSDEINTVKIDDISFSGYSLKGNLIECSPTLLKLRGTSSRTICTVKDGVISSEGEAYETLLQVTLAYGYSQTVSKQMRIERP